MFNLPYFWRLWVFREARVSSKALAFWGKCEIDWHEIGSTVYWLGLNHYFHRTFNSAAVAAPNFETEKETWPMLLYSTKRKKTMDPKDKMFAPIALTKEETKSRRKKLKADYTMSFTEVSVQLIRNLVSCSGKLHILSFADVLDLHPSDKQPLWAPRWEVTDSVVLLWDGFEAVGDSSAYIQDSNDPSILIAKGFCVDVVEMCSKILEEKDSKDAQHDAVAEAWEVVISASNLGCDKGQGMKTFVSTITAGKTVRTSAPFPIDGGELELLDFSAYQLLLLWAEKGGADVQPIPEKCQRYRLELAECALNSFTATVKLIVNEDKR